ncbi:MAG TPA: serine hydrolase domain-containing protein [Gemmatimonadales bacterium]|nr:serine hydrolase domain-containing protein [Gemmatimonadales bacterium]
MKRVSVIVVTLLLLVTALPAQQADARIARLNAYLAAAAELGHVNGSVLVAEQGKVLVDTAFGFANFELGVRNTPDTRFRVASVTKQFAALATMMLAQDGALRLDDPITKYVDSLPASWHRITIHDLLRHTSGISDYEGWFGGYSTQAYSDFMSAAHASERIVQYARTLPLDFEPGTRFHYSNSAYVILGLIIERVSGMSLDAFLQQRIHEPLGMTLSAQDRSDVLIPNRAAGYQLLSGTMPRAYYAGLTAANMRNAVYQKMEPPQAEAGLITTARDLYRWDQALYTERLLPKAALDSIFTPGLGGYGYGWFIKQGVDGITYEHSGGLPGFTCYIMRIPGTHRTIIVLNNVQTLGRTVTDLAAILRGDSVAIPHAHQLLADDRVRDRGFVGTYRTASQQMVEIQFEGETLVVQRPGGFRSRLYAEDGGGYFVEATRGSARLERDGPVHRITMFDALGREQLVATKPSMPRSMPML